MRSTIFLFLLLPFSAAMSDIEPCTQIGMSATTPPDYLDKCVEALEKGTETTLSGTQILLGILKETTAQRILKAQKITVRKIILKDSDWTTLEIAPQNLSIIHTLEVINNPFLTTIIIPKTVKGNILRVRGNKKLSKESIEKLKMERRFKKNNLQTVGECGIDNPITDFSQVEGCSSITGIVSFLGNSSIKGKPQMIILGKDSCLLIKDTNLTNLPFLDVSKATKKENLICSEVSKNTNLCLSEKTKTDINRIWPGTITPENRTCEFECLADDVVKGKVPEVKICHVIRGNIVLKGLKESSKFPSLATVTEIRGGGLKITNSTMKAFKLLPNLISIDMEDKKGPAIEVSGNEMASFELPYLIKIERNGGNGPLIVMKENKGLKLSKAEKERWKELANGMMEFKVEETEASKNEGKTETKSEDEQDSESSGMVIGIGVGLGVAVVVVLMVVVVICVWKLMNKKGFYLPKIKRVPKSRKSLFMDLVKEILELNPYQWREAMKKEAKHKNSSEKTATLGHTRRKCTEFLDKYAENPPVPFRIPSEAKDYEIYGMLDRVFKLYKGKGILVLLSKHRDPSISVSVLGDKEGEEQKLAGILKEESSGETSKNHKDSSVGDLEVGGTKFDIYTKLLKIKKFNEDITLCTYTVKLGEELPGKDMVYNEFQMVVANYHTWSSGAVPKDRTTVLKLCEYSKKANTVFAAEEGSNMFTFLLCKAFYDFLTNAHYPNISLLELKAITTDLAKLLTTPSDALNFCMMVVLDWANREKVIPGNKAKTYKDFAHIYEKLIKFTYNNPGVTGFDIKAIESNVSVQEKEKSNVSVHEKQQDHHHMTEKQRDSIKDLSEGDKKFEEFFATPATQRPKSEVSNIGGTINSTRP